jgi:hypothetical protein
LGEKRTALILIEKAEAEYQNLMNIINSCHEEFHQEWFLYVIKF